MLNEKQYGFFKIVYYIPAVLACLVLIIVPPIYFFTKQLRQTSSIPIALSISEIFYVIFVFISPQYKSPVRCAIRNFFLRFGTTTTAAWCLIYNFDIYISVKRPLLRTNVYHKYYHLFVWSYGIVTYILFLGAMVYDDQMNWEQYVGWDYCQLGGIGLLFIIHTISHAFYLVILLTILLSSWKRLRRGLPGTRLVRTVTLTRISIFSLMTCISIIFTTLFFIIDQYQKEHSIISFRSFTNIFGNMSIALQGLCVGIFLLTHPVIIDKVTKWRKWIYNLFIPNIPRSLDPLNEGIFRKVPENISLTSDVKMIEEVVRRDVIYQAMLGLTVALKLSRKLPPVPQGSQTTSGKKLKYDIPIEYDTKLPEIGVLVAQDFVTLQKFKRIRSPTTSAFRFLQYCPRVFRAIRLKFGISDEDYINSFRPESVILDFIKKNFSEGKSQSFFCFTESGNFIMKTVSRGEKKCLLRVLGRFQMHVFENPETLIKFPLGLYTLDAWGFSITFIVLHNCMYGQRTIERRFDLKGSSVSRKAGLHASLGKDLDLKKLLAGDRIKIPESIYYKLQAQLKKDSELFRDLNIMDYSLLLGFEDLTQKESTPILTHPNGPWYSYFDGGIISSDKRFLLRFGIIDLLQQYNLSKKLEHFAKVTFKCVDGKSISAVNAEAYCSRFTKNIMDFFEPGDDVPSDIEIIPEYVPKTERRSGIFTSFKTWLRSGTVELDEYDNQTEFLMDSGLNVLNSIHIIDDDNEKSVDQMRQLPQEENMHLLAQDENTHPENYSCEDLMENDDEKSQEIEVYFEE